ncbi:MAG: hypothetical protein QHI38_06500 [Armatimonadota bacterium]|jgi:hypothetical protein|nr:hypothetical protein [Armatimonadota bacterium]
MRREPESDFKLQLKNVEGIPILRLAGNVTSTALKAVTFTLDKLIRAGHFSVVLNVERVNSDNLLRFLNALSASVRKFREHHGVVELVEAGDRVARLAQVQKLKRLFRFSHSEQQAISRIKRLVRYPDSVAEIDAHIT